MATSGGQSTPKRSYSDGAGSGAGFGSGSSPATPSTSTTAQEAIAHNARRIVKGWPVGAALHGGLDGEYLSPFLLQLGGGGAKKLGALEPLSFDSDSDSNSAGLAFRQVGGRS